MTDVHARGVLLDIEGTVCSIRYVYEVLFPYARDRLQSYLERHWESAEVAKARDLIAVDAGYPSYTAWSAGNADRGAGIQVVLKELVRLMDGDVKATGLKELQGLIWRDGFRSGELKSQIYPDVPPALHAWHAAGITLHIFSSGSAAAQKLFFAHTQAGNLAPLLSGHYDTTLGPKKVAASYRTIAQQMELPPGEILFCSDIVAELDAAREAGMQTALAIRPGNAAVSPSHDHREFHTFEELKPAR